MDSNEILDSNLDFDVNKKEIALLSTTQFMVLYILSFGLYGIWWMYKSWKFFKEKDHLDIMPAARAIFAVIFIYSLFERIKQYAQTNGYTNDFSILLCVIGFILLNALSRLPDPYWLVSFLGGFFLIAPLNAMNYAIKHSDDFKGVDQQGFNSRQYAIILIGSIFSILVLIALFMGL